MIEYFAQRSERQRMATKHAGQEDQQSLLTASQKTSLSDSNSPAYLPPADDQLPESRADLSFESGAKQREKDELPLLRPRMHAPDERDVRRQRGSEKCWDRPETAGTRNLLARVRGA
jgi:hypothetical protein